MRDFLRKIVTNKSFPIFLVGVLALGAYGYVSLSRRQEVPSGVFYSEVSIPEPGASFVDAFGNTVPAISAESYAKMPEGFWRYLIFGTNPTVVSGEKLNENRSEMRVIFTVSEKPPGIREIYRAYFQKAGWEMKSSASEGDASVSVFTRDGIGKESIQGFAHPYESAELRISPAATGSSVVLTTMFIFPGLND